MSGGGGRRDVGREGGIKVEAQGGPESSPGRSGKSHAYNMSYNYW